MTDQQDWAYQAHKDAILAISALGDVLRTDDQNVQAGYLKTAKARIDLVRDAIGLALFKIEHPNGAI